MATVEVRELRKKFGKVVALDGASFDVAEGEFFCLLGPSGAGKTTTLRSIAGLVRPEDGSVLIDGEDVADVEPNHRNLAMCFESYALYPQLSVFDNMASPLRSPTQRVPANAARERIGAIAEVLGIDQLLDRGVGQLSNGQRQRVALGRVLVRPAHAYLLDEPLAHLDAKLRTAMRAELKRIAHGELTTTTIYVTHDYIEAVSLADRIGVLSNGRILQVGTPEDLWHRPANAFVAQAFGKPRINFVDGVLVDGVLVDGGMADGDMGPRFVGSEGAVTVPVSGVEAHAGEAVRIGIRPRDLVIRVGARDVPAGHVELSGTVYVLEHLGRQAEVTVQVGQDLLSVVMPRAEASGLAVDDKVRLLVDPATVHVFLAGDEGRRIS